ncbi:hypothetical protein Rsub_07348 [Raphidocelis subcapitata]|uniref:C4-dicarboxylate transporter malic acid transport n=1 Tax=Raphidocelis subcapitata TaxID=307507 RepID=A0A2V0P892_9CHLO|nr:hypothetical protein Rsub_07348 [Raphidocelis subcapitata]|eukprot:GBF94080.1 hypothetical protein Rsub_07348 [Raphidocelis subcapitata]
MASTSPKAAPVPEPALARRHIRTSARNSSSSTSLTSPQQQQQQQQQLAARMFREFTPSWFTVCMGTGAFALAWAGFPWPFRGRAEIALAIWCLNVLCFLFFSVLMLGRLLVFRDTVGPLMRHPTEPLFLGAIPMAFAVISNGFVQLVGPRLPIHSVLVTAAALWYVNLPATLASSLLFPFYIITRHHHAPGSMTALWLLPIVPSNVAAGAAGVVASAHAQAAREMVGFDPSSHRQLLASVTVLGSMLWSYGLLLTLSVTTVYWHRLMMHRLPPAAQLVSSFLPVGAISMCGFGALGLSNVALYVLPDQSTELRQLESFLPPAGFAVALALWSYAFWWFVVAIASVADNLRSMRFNLGWWGATFPTGVFAILTTRLAAVLDLHALRAIAACLIAFLAVVWILVAAQTAKKGWEGHLFHAPCLHTYKQAVAEAAATAAAGAGAGGAGGGGGAAGSATSGAGSAGGGAPGELLLARIRSEHLCVDPGLAGMRDTDGDDGEAGGSSFGGSFVVAGGASGDPPAFFSRRARGGSGGGGGGGSNGGCGGFSGGLSSGGGGGQAAAPAGEAAV